MYEEVLTFWFDEIEPAQWWKKDSEFDALISSRFGALHARAKLCELFSWRANPKGRLAEVIVLDQFSRNMYRDTPAAFASDSLALCLAQEAISSGADKALSDLERSFLYLPFMHSESLLVHETAVALYKENGIESNYEFELKHKAIIEKFGRYPHRNGILGRQSTAEELAFLRTPGSSF